jgi:hypothetical protein
MPRFFDPQARVTFFSSKKPQGAVAIIRQPWQILGNDDIPLARPPLRRQHSTHHIDIFPEGDGIVHISVVTGERHTHGEIESVNNEPGMKRVISEHVRPQRPLGADAYRAFALGIQNASLKLFQRKATKATSEATNLDKDTSSIIASYLTSP